MKALTDFDYVTMRNPFDMSEGGDVRDNSTRLAYQRTARKMRQPKMPNPANKTAITSERGILFGGIPFFKPGSALVMDTAFYSGLLLIDNQPMVKEPTSFSTSGTPKSQTNF